MLISCWLTGMELVGTASAIPMRACNPKHKRAGRVQTAVWVSLLEAQASRDVGWKADLIWHRPLGLEVPLSCPANAAVIQQCFAPSWGCAW